MGYRRQFEVFNPVSGNVPSSPFSILPTIAQRARELLNPWSAEQIVSIATDIDWALSEYFREIKEEKIAELWLTIDEPKRWKHENPKFDDALRFFEWDGGSVDNGCWIFKDHMVGELDIPSTENTSEVDALKECEDCYVWTGNIFAVLSLSLLADAMEYLSSRYDISTRLSLAGECALKAMDAVCHAEHLVQVARLDLERTNKENLLQIKKVSFSDMGKNGAKIRHDPMRKLKEWMLEQYRAGTWPSANKAASELMDDVLAHSRTIGANLTRSNAQRTIAEWIRKSA